MKMKNILAGALAASSAVALATPAQAAITINAPTTVDWGAPAGDELTFSLGYEETGLSNPFTAVLDFTNTLGGSYVFALTTSASAVDFTSAVITGGTLGGPVALSSVFDDGTVEHWSLSNYGLDAGNYVLTIEGTNAGAGSLGGSVSFTAVPEPATWGMLILGFGLLGGLMRRRQDVRVRYNLA